MIDQEKLKRASELLAVERPMTEAELIHWCKEFAENNQSFGYDE